GRAGHEIGRKPAPDRLEGEAGDAAGTLAAGLFVAQEWLERSKKQSLRGADARPQGAPVRRRLAQFLPNDADPRQLVPPQPPPLAAARAPPRPRPPSPAISRARASGFNSRRYSRSRSTGSPLLAIRRHPDNVQPSGIVCGGLRTGLGYYFDLPIAGLAARPPPS